MRNLRWRLIDGYMYVPWLWDQRSIHWFNDIDLDITQSVLSSLPKILIRIFKIAHISGHLSEIWTKLYLTNFFEWTLLCPFSYVSYAIFMFSIHLIVCDAVSELTLSCYPQMFPFLQHLACLGLNLNVLPMNQVWLTIQESGQTALIFKSLNPVIVLILKSNKLVWSYCTHVSTLMKSC